MNFFASTHFLKFCGLSLFYVHWNVPNKAQGAMLHGSGIYANLQSHFSDIQLSVLNSVSLEIQNLQEHYQELTLYAYFLAEAAMESCVPVKAGTPVEDNGETNGREESVIEAAHQKFFQHLEKQLEETIDDIEKLKFKTDINALLNKFHGVDGFLVSLIYELYPYWRLPQLDQLFNGGSGPTNPGQNSSHLN